MKNLENLKTQELSLNELEQINGGVIPVAVVVAVAIFALNICWEMGKAYRQ
jgi:lactobin A/cerein 7B family class IIb bacteriocin